jgi:hypothetical protein
MYDENKIIGVGMARAQSADQYQAQREPAAAIARSQVELHSRELAGWSYIARVLKELPPDVEEEAALWNMLGRSRRERY